MCIVFLLGSTLIGTDLLCTHPHWRNKFNQSINKLIWAPGSARKGVGVFMLRWRCAFAALPEVIMTSLRDLYTIYTVCMYVVPVHTGMYWYVALPSLGAYV